MRNSSRYPEKGKKRGPKKECQGSSHSHFSSPELTETKGGLFPVSVQPIDQCFYLCP